MDASDNTLGHHTNKLAAQRLQYYQGCVVIGFQHLRFQNDSALGSRLLDERNVTRIIKIFEIEGCGNLEPEHRVAALVDGDTLSRALSLSGLTRDAILDPTKQSRLFLGGDVHLTCVYGRHRLKAAESFGETNWLVDLYLDQIPAESVTQLREESAKSLDLTDGEIYRTMRLYQISQNTGLERKWQAKLKSDGRRQDIRRLQRDGVLLSILDKLLPYVGLWKPLKTTQIERMLGLKCPELLRNYLKCVHETWSHILDVNAGLLVDPSSVQLLEGLMPRASFSDRSRINHLVETGQVFALVSETAERESIRSRLFSTPGRIISLNTMVQDTLFLEEPARALRRICPKFTGSFRNAMRYRWSQTGTQRALEIQKSEHKFDTIQHSADSFTLCIMQLWLFAFRHFIPQQRRAKNQSHFGWSTEAHSLRKLAGLAHRLGFESKEIGELLSENLYQSIAKGFIESLCKEDFYIIEQRRITALSTQVQRILRNLPIQSEEEVDAVEYVTNNPESEAKNRFNCPALDQHESQRKFLFLESIFGPEQAAAQYPTPLGVTREMLLCFFGHKLKNVYSGSLNDEPELHIQQFSTQEARTQSPIQDNFTTSQNPESIEEHTGISNEIDEFEGMTEDRCSSQYSRSPGLPVITEEIFSEPVEIEPHPSGTPDAPPPVAPGFEDASCIGPMEQRNHLTVRRRVPEILNIWFQAQHEVVVIFLFESRTYFKFSQTGGFNLRSTLQDLSREHIFITINEFGIGTPDINKTYEETLRERLLLVCRRDNPAQGKDEIGMISLDRLQDYILNYDILTGKRKADNNADLDSEPRKRPLRPSSHS